MTAVGLHEWIARCPVNDPDLRRTWRFLNVGLLILSVLATLAGCGLLLLGERWIGQVGLATAAVYAALFVANRFGRVRFSAFVWIWLMMAAVVIAAIDSSRDLLFAMIVPLLLVIPIAAAGVLLSWRAVLVTLLGAISAEVWLYLGGIAQLAPFRVQAFASVVAVAFLLAIVFAAVGAFVAVYNRQLFLERAQLRQEQEALREADRRVAERDRKLREMVLRRYLPPALVTDILDGKLDLERSARVAVVTVLFSDLCDFTQLASDLGATGVAEVLCAYLDRMIAIIFEHDGTIEKFAGDAIMVIFGAPVEVAPGDQVDRATRCAIAMQDAIPQVNDALAEQLGRHRLAMRIGIHQGPVVVGNIGNSQRSDYTAIGPATNLAARIQTACSPGRVLVTREVAAQLPAACTESAGFFRLKGISDDIEGFHVRVRS